jgi:hypothetical protein
MKSILLIFIVLSVLFVFCDAEKLFRDAPVIEEIMVQPNRVNPFDTVYAHVKATNPEEGSLSYQWSVSPSRGSFLDPLDGSAVRWLAPTVGGDYTFKVVIKNSYKSAEQTGTVKVIEPTAPLVRITSPHDGEYFIQLNEIVIKADALHNNGINKIQLFVNDRFLNEQSGSPTNKYEFSFTPDSTYLGPAEIKIRAIANFSLAAGADSITVNIEGILPVPPHRESSSKKSL